MRALTLGMLCLLASTAGVRPESEPGAPVDLRSYELVRLDCAAGALKRGLTLFANGTVRILDEGGTEPGMRLAELDDGELDAFRARLTEIDLSETRSRFHGPTSDTLEQCALRLELTPGSIEQFRFARIAALSLSLGRLLAVLDDLTSIAEERERLASGLPASYEPRVGDVLIKSDGSRHRIVRLTADGTGVEIIGLESPLVLYLARESVRGEFVALETRRRRVRRTEP